MDKPKLDFKKYEPKHTRREESALDSLYRRADENDKTIMGIIERLENDAVKNGAAMEKVETAYRRLDAVQKDDNGTADEEHDAAFDLLEALDYFFTREK